VGYKLDKNQLFSVMKAKLVDAGVSKLDAEIVSKSLIETSLQGIDTHGVRLFPYYVKEYEGGRSNKKPRYLVENETDNSALIDAGGANGIVAGKYAMGICIDKARKSGISVVSVKNSNHFGAASIYTKMASDSDLIGISMSNSDALVAPEGYSKAFVGTNPISISVPSDDELPFLLDFATSQVAYSKVKNYLERGIVVPSGWGIDEKGVDSSISSKLEALSPLGGYKGMGMAFMVQMLTCVLSGTPLDHELSHLYSPPYNKPRNISHFFMAINPELFVGLAAFKRSASRLMNEALHLYPGITLPGIKELDESKRRHAHGIPLSYSEYEYFTGFSELHEDEVLI